MKTAMVTTKGRIVIPSEIRRRRNITRGTRICFIEQGEEIVLRPVADDDIAHLKGSWGSHGKALKALMEEKRFGERPL